MLLLFIRIELPIILLSLFVTKLVQPNCLATETLFFRNVTQLCYAFDATFWYKVLEELHA